MPHIRTRPSHVMQFVYCYYEQSLGTTASSIQFEIDDNISASEHKIFMFSFTPRSQLRELFFSSSFVTFCPCIDVWCIKHQPFDAEELERDFKEVLVDLT